MDGFLPPDGRRRRIPGRIFAAVQVGVLVVAVICASVAVTGYIVDGLPKGLGTTLFGATLVANGAALYLVLGGVRTDAMTIAHQWRLVNALPLVVRCSAGLVVIAAVVVVVDSIVGGALREYDGRPVLVQGDTITYLTPEQLRREQSKVERGVAAMAVPLGVTSFLLLAGERGAARGRTPDPSAPGRRRQR